MAEWTGLEPATPGVTGRYSNQLNYHSSQLLNFTHLTNVGGKDYIAARDNHNAFNSLNNKIP